jgi:hypothetical protein
MHRHGRWREHSHTRDSHGDGATAREHEGGLAERLASLGEEAELRLAGELLTVAEEVQALHHLFDVVVDHLGVQTDTSRTSGEHPRVVIHKRAGMACGIE